MAFPDRFRLEHNFQRRAEVHVNHDQVSANDSAHAYDLSGSPCERHHGDKYCDPYSLI